MPLLLWLIATIGENLFSWVSDKYLEKLSLIIPYKPLLLICLLLLCCIVTLVIYYGKNDSSGSTNNANSVPTKHKHSSNIFTNPLSNTDDLLKLYIPPSERIKNSSSFKFVKPSPREIRQEIEQQPIAYQDDFCQTFIHKRVCWFLKIEFVETIQNSPYSRICFDDFVESVIDLNEFPQIKFKKTNDTIVINGTIEKISIPNIYIAIHGVAL